MSGGVPPRATAGAASESHSLSKATTMTPAENTWLATAETVAGDVLDRHACDADGRWPAESVAALAASGLLGLCVPAEFGGGGASPTEFTAVVTALARRCASTGMIYLMHAYGTQVVAQARSFPPREAVLREIAVGRHLTTLAFSEKGSRSHFWAPVSRAVADGENYRLSAEKSWETSAHHADSYVVSAGQSGGGGSRPTAPSTTLRRAPPAWTSPPGSTAWACGGTTPRPCGWRTSRCRTPTA